MPARKLLRLIGTLTLAVGLLAAVMVYRSRPPDADEDEFANKGDLYQMERIGGKADVLAAEIETWFTGLWQGRRLAFTLGCMASGTFVVCFALAALQGEPPPNGKNERNDP
jgi:hypothetical protein